MEATVMDNRGSVALLICCYVTANGRPVAWPNPSHRPKKGPWVGLWSFLLLILAMVMANQWPVAYSALFFFA
jgi:hypothetical protein